jgi:hypothetical protein
VRLRTLPFFLVAGSACSAAAAIFTVSKDGRGAYATIQAAVDKAGRYDQVLILDTATYAEQVTLRPGLDHFSLRSADPSSPKKPVIRWQDNANTGPRTCQEALVPEKITYDKNGALRLLDVRDVRIEGIAIDGGGAWPFSNPNVWGNGTDCNGALYPLFHGNTGLLVSHSSQVVVSECEIRNAYFGAYVADRLQDGPFAPRGGPYGAVPFARMALGNHLFSGNSIHHNSWGVFMENAWGPGSTFRDNLVYENHHATPAAAAAVKAMSSEGANQPGGAFLFKDAQYSAMTLQNNTFWHDYLLFAGGFRPGAQHLIANNIFAAPNIAWSRDASFPNHFMALDPYFPKRMNSNAYAAQTETPVLHTVTASASETDPVSGDLATVSKDLSASALPVRIMNNMPVLKPDTTSILAELQLRAGPKPVRIPLESGVYQGAVLEEGSVSGGFSAADRNRWVETRFRSLDPADPGFLRPAPESEEFLLSGSSPLPYPEAMGSPSLIGAVPASERPASLLRIVPLSPVLIESGHMVLRFAVQAPPGGATGAAEPAIEYLRLERKLPANPNGFGGTASLILPEAEAIPVPAASLHYGYNEVKLAAPGPSADSSAIGFVEMAVRGMGLLSNVAQFPILPLVPLFTVEAWDETQDAPASGFAIGKAFRLRIAYAGSPAGHFATPAYPVRLSLASGAALKILDTANADSSGILRSALPAVVRVQFTEAPADGVELAWASSYADTAHLVTGYGQSRALVFDATTSVPGSGKSRATVRPTDILRRRNLMGRKVTRR